MHGQKTYVRRLGRQIYFFWYVIFTFDVGGYIALVMHYYLKPNFGMGIFL